MRVVHLIDSGGFYGAEVMLLNLCIEQLKLGIDVEVISIGTIGQPTKPVELKLREANIQVYPWRMHALPDLRQSLKIIRYCLDRETRVIHSHGYKGNILLGLVPKSLRKIPTVTTIHGYTRQQGINKLALYQWLDRACLKRLDAVVLVSPAMMDQVPTQKLKDFLHVIPNGIPDSQQGAVAENYRSLFSADEFKVGALGRLSYEKNFQLLIEAVPHILKDTPNAKVVIYGEGGERTELEAMITQAGLQEKVLLPGYLKNTSAFLKEIDVFVNCSITEGMPISILESMREGCLLVATDIPANREVIFPVTQDRFLCRAEKHSLADKILSIFKQSMLEKKHLSTLYNKEFNEKYRACYMAKNYLNVYESVQ